MAETDIFYCEPRERTGTGGARASRREGWVPGVIYGGGEPPAAIRLKSNEVQKAFFAGRMRAQLAKIDVPGEDGQQTVIARDVQIDPVKGWPIHVDLLRVDEKTRIKVEIPVRFLNEDDSPGLKKGGVLNVVRHTVEVIPHGKAGRHSVILQRRHIVWRGRGRRSEYILQYPFPSNHGRGPRRV